MSPENSSKPAQQLCRDRHWCTSRDLQNENPVVISGEHLSIPELVQVARNFVPVRLTEDPTRLSRLDSSCRYLAGALRAGRRIYGVNTGFGAMIGAPIDAGQMADLQTNLIWFLKAGAGPRLPTADVRAAMLLRANSCLRGVSGIRYELIRRLAVFLNARATPCVREFGSIGASGDLVPLASIAGALIGLNPGFSVDFDGEEMDAPSALERLGLSPLELQPKEGLAMVNGTSAMTGIAATCVHDFRILLNITLAVHALLIQALGGMEEPSSEFIHRHKPHVGQGWAASRMRELLAGSGLVCRKTDSCSPDHKPQAAILCVASLST
jgi:phenylalanine ammonia-lyase